MKYQIIGIGNIPDSDENTVYFEYQGKRYEASLRELIDSYFLRNRGSLLTPTKETEN